MGPARAPFVAFSGGIPILKDQENGGRLALLAAIKAMTVETQTSFIIFPQGNLERKNQLIREHFQPGLALLAKKVTSKGGAPIDLVPAAIHYIRDPRHASTFHRIMNHLGWRNFRNFVGETIYGAVVVIGERIPAEALPAEVDATMDLVFARICDLSRQAENVAQRRLLRSPGKWCKSFFPVK